VVVLLKSLKILFGTDKNGEGQDYDPTIALVNHIVECVGALRDVHKVYSAKGSVAAKSIGTRALYGLTSELSSLMLGKMLPISSSMLPMLTPRRLCSLSCCCCRHCQLDAHGVQP
jgi:hypothetical protein